MKRAEILVFLNALTKLVLENRIDEAASRFKPPLAAYFPHNVVIIHSHAQMKTRLSEYRRNCCDRGIVRIEPSQPIINDSTDMRALATLDLRHLDTYGNVVCLSTVSYVLSRTEGKEDLRIELVDFARPGFPQMGRSLDSVMSPVPERQQHIAEP
jgi:hypothetical protein